MQESAGILFGKVRRGLLSLFLLNPDKSYHFRQIRDILGSGSGAVHRELAHLVKAEILVRNKIGNQTRYQANTRSAIYEDLRNILLKTSGVPRVILEGIKPLMNRVEVAFIFGSYADGTFSAQSDIDLMVIGDVEFDEVAVMLQDVQREIRREINPAVYSTVSLREKRGTGFIKSVLEGDKYFLKGGENELEELVR